ncbi:UNKNOWN [Stylonychia lemnae]|uniref:Uncharacterized protein n=1 Tax=Stylonychia lemnae TaxID=5949 RepID=A0A078AHH1_STYLE|nr:UNKNOWN [Stylonychia lemnae]|eukprot:CDW81735.1 UNKNOWN [Stylonychia lemnae]
MQRYNHYKPTQLGIRQTQIQVDSKQTQLKLIDENKGTIQVNGWGLNLDQQLLVNYQYAAPLSLAVKQLNNLKFRSWNYFLIHTPTHVIQVIFVDLNLGIACPSNLVVMERQDIKGTQKIIETMTCPTYNKETVSIGEKTELVADQWSGSVIRKEGSMYQFKVNSKAANFEMDLTFDYSENPGQVWATPLTNDLRTYYATQKKPVSVVGSYSYNNQRQQCKGGDCFMMIDIGRGHLNYGMAYFWVLIMAKLKDGRTIYINLCDGASSEFKTLDKANEDFIIVDGKHYKLDVTEMDYYKDNYMGRKTIRTAVQSNDYKKIYKNRSCEFSFEPQGQLSQGVNAAVIAMNQVFTYGPFKGFCDLDGDRIEIDNVFGHVEQVYSRW